MKPERLADSDMTKWLGHGDRGYDDYCERHPEFICPSCKVLFALNEHNALVAVMHELTCPAR
jgi:hypothetical protein